MGLVGVVLIATGLGENIGMISDLHQKWFFKAGGKPQHSDKYGDLQREARNEWSRRT